MRILTGILEIALLVASGAAYASTVQTPLTASDAQAYDRFGTSVAISGSLAIIGAIGVDASESQYNSGAAYLFDVMTGEQLFKLTAGDLASYDEFGSSVAISGGTAIVGAQRRISETPYSNGSAYLFNTATAEQVAKLTANPGGGANDRFGSSVAVSGGIAIVGAYGEDSMAGLSDTGTAYLFDAANGAQITKLSAQDATANGRFGISVAISGGIAIVGADDSDATGEDIGAAYLFDTATGTQIFKLTGSDTGEGDLFGRAVAISDGVAIVGAKYHDIGDTLSTGSAYLFNTATGEQIAKLTASDAAGGAHFGTSVAISGGIAIVGAGGDAGSDAGAVYLFDIDTGDQIGKLSLDDEGGNLFGRSIAISDGTVIVGDASAGRLSEDGEILHQTGAAYAYTGFTNEAPAPIPLPAGVWMLIAGLGSLRAVRMIRT